MLNITSRFTDMNFLCFNDYQKDTESNRKVEDLECVKPLLFTEFSQTKIDHTQNSFNTYEYVSRYLNPTPEETDQKLIRKNLDDLLDSLPSKTDVVNALLKSLKNGNWQSDIYNNKDYPYYALSVVKDGLLTVHEFGTVMLYWTISQYHERKEIQTVHLYDDQGNLNSEADKIFKYIMRPASDPLIFPFDKDNNPSFSNEILNSTDSLLSEAQEAKFYERIRKLPLSEQQFFMFPDVQKDGDQLQKELIALSKSLQNQNFSSDECKRLINEADDYFTLSISQTIHNNSRINMTRYEKMRVFLPKMMTQALLDVKYEEPVTITPTIGISTLNSIKRNGLTDTRDVALSFPGVNLPTKADGVPTKQDYDLSFHDVYHTILASSVPSSHRKIFIAVSDILKELESDKELEKHVRIIKVFKCRLRDMEHSIYRSNNLLGQEKIWQAMHDAFNHAILSVIDKGDDEMQSLADRIQKCRSEMLKSSFIKKFAAKLFDADFLVKNSQKLDTHSLALLGNKHKAMIFDTVENTIGPQLAEDISDSDRKYFYDLFAANCYQSNFLIAISEAMSGMS